MTETWSLEELKALTTEVASDTIEYRGKNVAIQWCELTEAIGIAKVKTMLTKADEMNPENACGLASVWDELPTTLRYQLTAKVLGAQTPDF